MSTKIELGYNKNLTYKIILFTILDIDHVINPQSSITRLEFIQNALSKILYIQTSRGYDLVFTDSIDPKFFPRTFPTLFLFSLRGPLGLKSVLSICKHIAELNNIGNKETT